MKEQDSVVAAASNTIYSSEELTEALRAITSLVGKCEKVIAKLTKGTSQHTLIQRRLKALYISEALIKSKLEEI